MKTATMVKLLYAI